MGRAEDGGGFGFDPDEYERFGDSQHPDWSRHGEWVDRHASPPSEPELWTEDELVRSETLALNRGDRVKAKNDVAGMLFTKVPAGTHGEVVSTRNGLLTSYVTVRFVNGYTEEVKASEVEKRGWW